MCLSSPFLTRELFRLFGSTSFVSVSGGQPFLVIHGRFAFLSWLTPPFSYGRRSLMVVRQKYCVEVLSDIKVVVYCLGLWVWFVNLVVSCNFSLFGVVFGCLFSGLKLCAC